jgi:hypothetical protein
MANGFRIEFAVHVPEDRIASMVTVGAYGLLRHDGDDPISYIVEVLRSLIATASEQQLQRWEEYGFLTWSSLLNSGRG